jgi:hypothetical protein
MRTARLSLLHQGKSADIFFSDGQVVHAENETKSGEDVIFQSLSWDDGTLRLTLMCRSRSNHQYRMAYSPPRRNEARRRVAKGNRSRGRRPLHQRKERVGHIKPTQSHRRCCGSSHRAERWSRAAFKYSRQRW